MFLLTEMLKDKDIDVQIEAIKSLGNSQAKSCLSYLHKIFSEDSSAKLREAAVRSLGGIGSAESIELLEITAMDTSARVKTRLAAITALANMGSVEAVSAVLDILKKTNEPYQLRAIITLGKIGARSALPLLREQLEAQVKRRADWRTLRDEDIDSYTDEQIEDWRKKIAAKKPKRYLEHEIAFAISQLDLEEGLRLLAHDLSAAREGAWMGLAKVGTVALLERLDRRRKKSRNPLFRHTAYRAIDGILVKTETLGSKDDLKRLEALLPNIIDTVGVYTRVEWTIHRLREKIEKKELLSNSIR